HASARTAPYPLRAGGGGPRRDPLPPATSGTGQIRAGSAATPQSVALGVDLPAGTVPLDRIPGRQQVTVVGRVHAVRVQPWGSAPSLEATIRDGHGELTLVFLGRRGVGGVGPGPVVTP